MDYVSKQRKNRFWPDAAKGAAAKAEASYDLVSL